MKHFIPRSLNYFGLLQLINTKSKVFLNDKEFIIPIVNRLGLQNIAIESSWLRTMADPLLKIKNGFFIDVGVNLGQTLLQLKSIDRELPYIGFEPNVSCCYYLSQLIRENKLPSTKVIPVGLCHEHDVRKFYIRHDEDSGASMQNDLRPGFFKEDGFRLVPTVPLDALIGKKLEVDAVAIIKIDVEGGELEVIEGAQTTIENYRPFIFCEILDFFSNEVAHLHQERAQALYELLRVLNYKAVKIILNESEGVENLQSVTGVHLRQWTKRSKCENDYLFYPSEFEDTIRHVLREIAFKS